MAKHSGPSAVAGLKAATMDAAYNQALRSDGTLDWSKYTSWLNNPVSSRGPSPLKIMEQQGVMSRREVVNLRRILHGVGKLESSATRGTIEGLTGLADPLFDLAVRIFGAQASQLTMMGRAAGPSLVIAGAGVRFAKNLFENVPISKMQDVAIEAANSPKVMADLLLRTSSPAKKKAAAGRIRLWLITSGFAAPEKLEPRIKDIHSH